MRRGDREVLVSRGGQRCARSQCAAVTVLRELELVTLTEAIRQERGSHHAGARSCSTHLIGSSDEIGLQAGDVIVQVGNTPIAVPTRAARAIDAYGARGTVLHVVRARWPHLPLQSRSLSADLATVSDRSTPRRSPIGTRRAPCSTLWGPATRYGFWRRLWLALAESQRELGIDIPDAAIDEMRAHLDDIDFEAVAEYERKFRHDVMAHVHAFGDVAPAARPFIHLGATSCYVTDNAELILMRRGLVLLREKLLDALRVAGGRSRASWRDAAGARLHASAAGAAHHGRQARDAVDAGPAARSRGPRSPHRDAAVSRREGHHRHAGELPVALRRRPRRRCASSIGA